MYKFLTKESIYGGARWRSSSHSACSLARITFSQNVIMNAFHFAGSERADSRTRVNPNSDPTASLRISRSSAHAGHCVLGRILRGFTMKARGRQGPPYPKDIAAEAAITRDNLDGPESQMTLSAIHLDIKNRYDGLAHSPASQVPRGRSPPVSSSTPGWSAITPLRKGILTTYMSRSNGLRRAV